MRHENLKIRFKKYVAQKVTLVNIRLENVKAKLKNIIVKLKNVRARRKNARTKLKNIIAKLENVKLELKNMKTRLENVKPSKIFLKGQQSKAFVAAFTLTSQKLDKK